MSVGSPGQGNRVGSNSGSRVTVNTVRNKRKRTEQSLLSVL